MNAKLTLTLDKELIEESKEYARSSGKSLSSIIERYLRSLLEETQSQDKDQPAIEIDGSEQANPDFDLIGDYTSYLIDRYQ